MRAIVSHAGTSILTIIIVAALQFCVPQLCQATSAHLSLIPQAGDTPERVSLVIDKVDKLAGMKVTITYNEDQLTFVKAEKAKAVGSFMHVVNDKNPGSVIIVIASASGISGTDVPLLHLHFDRKDAAADAKGVISVSQIQLMDENLQEISGDKPAYSF